MQNDTQALSQQMQRLSGARLWMSPDCLGSWQPISAAPFGCDLQLSVIEQGEVHALVFACRRAEGGGWINGLTRNRVPIDPTHWRHWDEEVVMADRNVRTKRC